MAVTQGQEKKKKKKEMQMVLDHQGRKPKG